LCICEKMDRRISLPVQDFVRAVEHLSQFAINHKGMLEDDCEAVLFHARKLISDLEEHCSQRNHRHDTFEKWAA
jgi:hypothetical protein